MEFPKKERYTLEDLLEITRILRSENGCPWDREQDHHSIRREFLEEAYEAVEAIDTDNPVLLREELGDVLFQVVFHAQIEAEKGVFDFSDVVHDVTEKMVVRHPHVFGEVKAQNADEALQSWDAVKMTLKDQKTQAEVLRSITPAMPALMRTEKILKKAEKAGAKGSEAENLSAAVHALEALQANDPDEETRIGELLLAVTDLARRRGIQAEDALAAAASRYIDAFEAAYSAKLSK